MLEAIYHVVEHFSMHTGQIIFATKLLTGTDLGFYAHLEPPPARREAAIRDVAAFSPRLLPENPAQFLRRHAQSHVECPE